jgi:hypothetical protein
MRLSPRICCLAIVAACCTASSASAEDGSYTTARDAARRALEKAIIELRLYQQVEYPRELRHLDADIELTKAEIETLRQRLRACWSYNHFSRNEAQEFPAQDLKLCLLEAELRLKDLQTERNALIRFHPDQWRLLELNVYEARVRVIELERTAELPPPDPSA